MFFPEVIPFHQLFDAKITEVFAIDVSKTRHDVNQSMKARNERGIKGELRFIRKADILGRAGAHKDTVPGNAQLLDTIICLQIAEKTKASCLLRPNDDEASPRNEQR